MILSFTNSLSSSSLVVLTHLLSNSDETRVGQSYMFEKKELLTPGKTTPDSIELVSVPLAASDVTFSINKARALSLKV